MKRLCASVLTSAIVLSSQMSWPADTDLAALEQAAKKEGEVNSVGMPDSWANWKGTWQDLLSKYGLKHVDTDMSSAQEIAKFDAEKNNATAQRTFANSPHLFVDKWDTPILCIHGEKDFRILANQAMAAFDAAVMRGVPAELLIYPDENHWVLQPQNGVLWQRTFFEWLDKWLKPAK